LRENLLSERSEESRDALVKQSNRACPGVARASAAQNVAENERDGLYEKLGTYVVGEGQ